MLRIRTELSNFSWNKDNRSYVTEASSIGLAPGCWPEEIEVCDRDTSREAIFYRKGPITFHGKLNHYVYDNASTIILKIFHT